MGSTGTLDWSDIVFFGFFFPCRIVKDTNPDETWGTFTFPSQIVKMVEVTNPSEKALVYGGIINENGNNNSCNTNGENKNNNNPGTGQQQCCGGLPEEIDNTFVWTMISIVIWLLVHHYIVNPVCFTNTPSSKEDRQ